jgi:hypothetical protein
MIGENTPNNHVSIPRTKNLGSSQAIAANQVAADLGTEGRQSRGIHAGQRIQGETSRSGLEFCAPKDVWVPWEALSVEERLLWAEGSKEGA